VHGAVDSGQGFSRVIDVLPELTVIAYDRRGHGTAIERLGSAPGFAGHVMDLLDLAGVEPVVVVGHSVGGAIALTAAAQAPDRIRAVGIYETALPWSEWWSDAERAGMLDNVRSNTRRALDRHPAGDPAHDRTVAAWRACELDVLSLFAGPFNWDELSVPVVVGVGTTGSAYSSRDSRRLAEHLGAPLMVLDGADHLAHRTQPDGFARLVRRTVAAG
jgi:pimeloyl-ACP methyl ester carboxylesterase